MIKETFKYLIVPALLTLALLGGVDLVRDVITYQHTITGTAITTNECETSPDEMFNECAVLDTSQVQDLR